MRRKKLEELNLIDDFLFGCMVTYPEIGEKFCRLLIGIITGRQVDNVKIVPQKVYYGGETDRHGIRLDVCIEEEDSPSGKDSASVGTVYDIEPDKDSSSRMRKALPRRVRYYRAKIDGKGLGIGESYSKLKNTVIIMILPYDPFGRDRMLYTVQNTCIEEPDIPYQDGATTLFLYTRGKKGNPPKELRQLLTYMEETTEENAESLTLKELQKMVETVKRDEEVSYKYMKVFEREQMLREEGREEERENTLREKKRADDLEEKLKLLQEKYEEIQKQRV